MTPKCLVIFVGPSGYGKSTLVDALVKRRPYCSLKIMACTSRAQRETDEFDSEYGEFNVPATNFAAEDMFEFTRFGSNLYGYKFKAFRNFVNTDSLTTAYTVMSSKALMDITPAAWQRLKVMGVESCVCVYLHSLSSANLHYRLSNRKPVPIDLAFRFADALEYEAAEFKCPEKMRVLPINLSSASNTPGDLEFVRVCDTIENFIFC